MPRPIPSITSSHGQRNTCSQTQVNTKIANHVFEYEASADNLSEQKSSFVKEYFEQASKSTFSSVASFKSSRKVVSSNSTW